MESAQDWTFICLRSAAQWALACRLLRNLYIDKTLKLSLTYTFDYVEPMDVLVLPTGIPVRIKKIDEDEDQILAIEAENFLYGASSASIYPTQQANRYQPQQNAADPGSTFPSFYQTTQAQTGGVANQINFAATGDNANWGGCQIWLSADGTDYSQIETINEKCALGVLSAPLAAGPDPDTTDTLSVDMTASLLNLQSASQYVANTFGTLCALISPDQSTVEFISYETATLTGSYRYNLTYLRRGAYGSPISAFPAGSTFVYIGSYKIVTYTFPTQYVGTTVYLKFPSFNLTKAYVQPLSQCKAYALVVGATGSLQNEEYVPSTFEDGSGGGGSVTNGAYDYDRNFLTYAAFSSGSSDSGAEGAAQYYGFPSEVSTTALTLYVSYQGLATTLGSAANGEVTIRVLNTATETTYTLLDQTTPGQFPSQGTCSWSIPVGTNLSDLWVQVFADNDDGGALATAAVNINEIWIQNPNVGP